jgi:virginiamycin B lyase
MAVAPDGSLWVALYAAGKLVRLDPSALEIARSYDLPGGRKSNPYAVAVDSSGRVYTSATGTNRILRLDPRTGEIEAFPLPGKHAMVRGLAVDREGRLWYAASATGKLGVLK